MQSTAELSPPSESFWLGLEDRTVFSAQAAAARLWHVAEGIDKSGAGRVTDTVKARAYKCLIGLLREHSRDGHGYLRAVRHFNTLAPLVGETCVEADDAWAQQVINSNNQRMVQLEQDLRHGTVSQIKESCRMAIDGIVRHATQTHDFASALQWYTSSHGAGGHGLTYRDRCSTPMQYAEMYVNMCELAVLIGKASDVHLFAAKVSQILLDTTTVPNAASIKAAISCLQGLCSASNGAYSAAASTLTKVNMQDVPPAPSTDTVLNGTLGGLFSVATACTTAVLCRIASANSRVQLKEGIACDADAAVQASNASFGLLRILCEYPRLQSLVDSAVECRYGDCLALVDEFVKDLVYDPLALGKCARMKCLIDYCSAFRVVPLNRVAADLGYPEVEALEPDLEAAIQGKVTLPGGMEEKLFSSIHGRIDLQAGVLQAVEQNSLEKLQETLAASCGPSGMAANLEKAAMELKFRLAALEGAGCRKSQRTKTRSTSPSVEGRAEEVHTEQVDVSMDDDNSPIPTP
ncbi:hypothetical protein FOL47_005412 [Perkinsus chesapeaki]|uniref:26S proteasome regulatory subunit Rpn7 N-terminal domain-containing protein n=1 Tax=Perkinsus chesapeaki TaxID=330153 RepID=A0A7J6N2N8_PERCH|nr:hypothetical protein FOL47_005412 [Perkinsus chesapeaki]